MILGNTSLRYNPYDPAVQRDPYPFYAALRDYAPLYHVAETDLWTLARYEDVAAASRNWEVFSYRRSVDLDNSGLLLGPGNFLACDPPTHTALRAIVRHAFTPKTAKAQLEEPIRREVNRALDYLAEVGECDIAHVLSWPLAMRVASALLGFPADDCDSLREVADSFLERPSGAPESPPEPAAGVREVRDYFAGEIATRVRRPREDLLTAIARATASSTLGEEEAGGLAGLVFLGAVDTTALLLSTGLWLLHEHPDERAHLLREPPNLDRAVEEILRYEAPVQFFKRTVVADITLHGERVPAGANVLLLYGSANRDERRFDRPDVFHILREPRRHLSFGDGIHHCLGAPVARLEAKMALEGMLARFPNYHVIGTPKWVGRPNARGVSELLISAR